MTHDYMQDLMTLPRGIPHSINEIDSVAKRIAERDAQYLQELTDLEDSVKPLNDKQLQARSNQYKWMYSKKQWEIIRQAEHQLRRQKLGLILEVGVEDTRSIVQKYKDVMQVRGTVSPIYSSNTDSGITVNFSAIGDLFNGLFKLIGKLIGLGISIAIISAFPPLVILIIVLFVLIPSNNG